MNNQTLLTEHFSLEEMVRSGVAIRRKIDNSPSPSDVERLRQLCVHVLEPVRRRFGVTRISSGYRSAALNDAVGGVATSQHLRGEAADIHISDMETGRRIYDYIRRNLDFDQLLFEHRMSNGCRWLHVSYTTRRPNRRQARPVEC
ncbi:MAG: peptidase M15 [Prevotella sp.]|nr:peptidase M15 [Prevotella sp.]